MYINKLELFGYKRLQLANIKYICITPNNKLQLILGTNGSGKSSLLKELSPLPAIQNEFTTDGYKIIEITHNKSTYILKSVFGKTNTFSFIKDDIELNPGNTITVYKELVLKEFNIDQDIFNIMAGAVSFHTMSVANRKSWFTKIADSDFTYAIKYYSNLKEKLRDIQGAIKLNQNRLAHENEKLLTDTDYDKLVDTISRLRKTKELLLELRPNITETKDQVRTKLNELETKLFQSAEQLLYYKKQFLNNEGFNSIEDIDDRTILIKSKIISLESENTKLCSIIENDNKLFSAIRNSSIDSITDVKESIKNKELEIKELTKQLLLKLIFKDPDIVYNSLLTIQNDLTSIFSTLPKLKSFTRTEYELLANKLHSLTGKYEQANALQLDLINKKLDLESLKETSKLECPNCNHIWHKEYKESDYLEVVRRLELSIGIINKLKTELDESNIKLEEAKEYIVVLSKYSNIIKSWSVLNPFWNHIDREGGVSSIESTIMLDHLHADLLLSIAIDGKTKELDELLRIQTILENNKNADIEHLESNITYNNELLCRNTDELNKCKSLIDTYDSYKNIVNNTHVLNKAIVDIVKDRESSANTLINLIRSDAINETIRVVTIELTKNEQIVSRIDTQKAIVKDIESSVNNNIEIEEVLKIAVKELSPNTGIIAKSVTGFINHFIHRVNIFIKDIWAYPLELQPIIVIDDVDLDYRFPVMVNDGIIVSDISKLSSGQQEIVGLAFRIVSMQFLKLDTAPLYLDEFAIRLDNTHRNSALNTIHSLITSSNFCQVYMVSHYEKSYSSLKNCDITVLCKSNIVLPKDAVFNKVTIIK